MRRAAKVDDNQTDIVDVLRAYGCTVQSLAMVGAGCPDLLVGYRGVTHLVEVKDGAKALSRRRLNPDQVEWHAAWKGAPVMVLESPAGAQAWLDRGCCWPAEDVPPADHHDPTIKER